MPAIMFGLNAWFLATLFAGIAFYISVVEHPTRMAELKLGDALRQWKPSYKRAAIIQALLAMGSSILGLIAWWKSGNTGWLLAALAIGANWPFTMMVIMPVNKTLLATDPEQVDVSTQSDLKLWGRLHHVRTGLGILAVILFIMASH